MILRRLQGLRMPIPPPVLRCRCLCSGYHTNVPWKTNYYELSIQDLDRELGERRVESSKTEAVVRRIAQKLFLYDSAQRAMLEQEIADDEVVYLSHYIDARDVAPRSKPIGQTRLSSELRQVLKAGHSTILSDIAKIFWEHQVRRISTYLMVCRSLIIEGYPEAAQIVMESVLMGQRSLGKLNTSAYTFCLELAMMNGDSEWFSNLSQRVELPENEWGPLQRKFVVTPGNSKVELLLAEGFMKFQRLDSLDKVLARNVDQKFYINLIAVNIEAAARWKEVERGLTAFSEFEKIWNPRRLVSMRILLLAKKIPELQPRAAVMIDQLSPKLQHEIGHLPSTYFHSYANEP